MHVRGRYRNKVVAQSAGEAGETIALYGLVPIGLTYYAGARSRVQIKTVGGLLGGCMVV